MREYLHDRGFNSWQGAETHRFDCVCLGSGDSAFHACATGIILQHDD
jgi:hypothetical protein